MVLVICLIFLLVVTLIATAGMQDAILQQRMAANLEDESLAFHAAESALAEAEEWLAGLMIRPAVTSTAGQGVDVWHRNSVGETGDLHWYQKDGNTWWGASGLAESAAISSFKAAVLPQYVIEELAVVLSGQSLLLGMGETAPQRIVYRITARGVGRKPETEVFLQSTYMRVFH